MISKKIQLLALLGALALPTLALASIETVTIDYGLNGSTNNAGTFTFTGNVEGNGDINLSDITSLSGNDFNTGIALTLPIINSFGTFDTLTNIWSETAADWDGNLDAYLTYGNNSYSVNAQNGAAYAVVSTSTIPEPASFALLVAGLLGLGALRTKKNQA